MSTTTKLAVAKKDFSIDDLPKLLVGSDTVIPTLHGPQTYINFDNAASTPTFQPILDAVNEFLKWYSNVHRGTGFKSQLSSWAFEEARDIVADFVKADLDRHVVLFTKNSTESINKLSHRLNFEPGDVVLTTLMEHHSNELPWRRVSRVEHIGLTPDGTICKEDFKKKLAEHGSRVKLVAITGASNVTGYINDINYFACEAHRAGARILVDGAQLIPHRPVSMQNDNPDCEIDFLVFSAHKMYAPFGVGVIVGDKKIFLEGEPSEVGGGMVDIVNLEEAYWTDLPDKEEAGTPDIVGVVALGKAIQMLRTIGWDSIIRHESELTAYALTELNKIPEVTLFGSTDPSSTTERLGVISFAIKNIMHAKSSAILSYEGGIGVRSGCFCAATYVKELLKISKEEEKEFEQAILDRDRSDIPGTTRMSFGIYNTIAEIDRFIVMIKKIVAGDYSKDYEVDKESGEFAPRGFKMNFQEHFKI